MEPETETTTHGDRGRELEWQFDAVDLRPVARWLAQRASEVGEPTREEQCDVYADTDDWRLHRAGFSLRIRSREGEYVATLKSLYSGTAGYLDREELQEPVAGGDPAAVLLAPGPVGERVRALVGPRPLRTLFEVRTSRTRFPLQADDARAEVALDDTSIPVPGDERPVRLQRVEVEVVSGSPDALVPFVDELRSGSGLQDAAGSKFEAGLLALGLVPAGVPDLGPTDVDDGMTVGEVAFACLRRRFADFLASEPGVRLGEDAEAVHDMRVASRRLRAALALFSEVLPARASRHRRELKWVADGLGEVRDLDVQLENLGTWAAELPPDEEKHLLEPIRVLEERRTSARRRLLRTLDSKRYERLVGSFTVMVQHGPPRRGPARAPVLAAAPDLIRRKMRKVKRAGDSLTPESDPSEFHALRIRCKRLRYTLEFFEPIYPRASRRLIRRLVEVQDSLGAHQDAQVARTSLRRLAADRRARLGPEAVFLLGRMAERYERLARAERERFPALYRRLRGRAWKRLLREVEARRPPRASRPSITTST
jgi:CHAD domain-containing protein